MAMDEPFVPYFRGLVEFIGGNLIKKDTLGKRNGIKTLNI